MTFADNRLHWGFAKSSPAAQRPATAQQPGSPNLIFHKFLASGIFTRLHTYTDLHRVWACKLEDGEFEFVYHFNNHFNPFRSFLSLHAAAQAKLKDEYNVTLDIKLRVFQYKLLNRIIFTNNKF